MDAPSCHDSACHVCDNLRFQDDHPIKCTVEALEVTTQDCAFCMLFMAAVKNKFGTNLPTISPVPGAWEGDFDLSAVPMDILKDVQVEVSTNMVIDIFQRSQHLYSLQVYSEEKSELCSRIPVLHYVPPTTGSLASFEQAGSWITDCMSNHALCRGSETEKPLLPARVVDVISYELHISEKEERAPYVCLSHCWGPPGHQRYMVTRENIDKNTDDIEWDALPRTFKEAIAWVQRTDIRYIWIDSLCIIQNDLKDWENEAAKMADIYENATITLAATHARSGDDGLFRTGRNLTMRMASPSSDSGSEIIRVCDRIEHITRHPWSIQSMPLLSRGWVFQERYLSRRILHFGPQELFWECLETSKCQCSKLDKATSAGFWLDPMYHVDQKRKYAQTLLDASPKEFIKRYPQGRFDDGWIKRRGGHLEKIDFLGGLAAKWREMISHYSGLSFTRTTDKLPALSGLATQMHRYRDTRYLAGLWEDTLFKDILWSCASSKSAKRYTDWHAPSWSWVSIDGPIRYPGIHIALVGKVLEKDTFINPFEVDLPRDSEPPDAKNQDYKAVVYFGDGVLARTESAGNIQMPVIGLSCRLLNAVCSTATENLFGAISSGYLQVAGYVLQLSTSNTTISMVASERSESKELSIVIDGRESHDVFPDYDADLLAQKFGKEKERFCMLRIGCYPYLQGSASFTEYSLLLLAVDLDTFKYERYGLVTCTNESSDREDSLWYGSVTKETILKLI